ncbi:hypothetical protein AB0K53_32835 [Streptomyces tuirus]|uniref:hypothetical protein n=1 Tax=Streptomyces tuirus TaxID=68278 RepID=UPI00342EA230
MADHVRSDDALLLFDDQQIEVQADVGLFLPDTGAWGGILRPIPERLADTIRNAEPVCLRMSSGQERPIRLLTVHADDTSVPFVGEGTAPF